MAKYINPSNITDLISKAKIQFYTDSYQYLLNDEYGIDQEYSNTNTFIKILIKSLEYEFSVDNESDITYDLYNKLIEYINLYNIDGYTVDMTLQTSSVEYIYIGEGEAMWGRIIGNIYNQTDLINLINDSNAVLKENVSVSNTELGLDLPYTFNQGETLTQIWKKLMQKISEPTLIDPSFSLSNNIGNAELGSTINVTLTFNFNRGNILGNVVGGVWDENASQGFRAGAATKYSFYKENGDLIIETVNNTVTFSHTILQTNNFYATVTYDAGIQPKKSDNTNFGSPYSAGTSNPVTTGFSGIIPYFYYKSGNLITGSIMESAITNGLASKIVANSNGTIILPYNAAGEYLAVAYPVLSTTKTKWFVTLLDNGDIPGGLFDSATNITTNSPNGYWTNKIFKFHRTLGPITQSNNIELRNN